VTAVGNIFGSAQAALQNMQGMEALNANGMSAAASANATPFAGMFQSMVSNTQQMETNATNAVTGLMNGSGVELHEAMIATQKADIAFEFALQVRNKAVAAYQQMMGMQF
jgi:flagellar hook-basal body complex protein FliE